MVDDTAFDALVDHVPRDSLRGVVLCTDVDGHRVVPLFDVGVDQRLLVGPDGRVVDQQIDLPELADSPVDERVNVVRRPDVRGDSDDVARPALVQFCGGGVHF